MANPMTRAERHKVSQEAQRVRALIAKLSPERRKAFKRELARMGDPRYDSPPSPSQQEARQVGGKTQARGIATQSSKRIGDLPARARAKLWHEERVRAKAEGREPRQTRQARPGGGRLTDREVMDIVNGMTPELLMPRAKTRKEAFTQKDPAQADREAKRTAKPSLARLRDPKLIKQPIKPVRAAKPVDIAGFQANARKGRPRKGTSNAHTNAVRAPWEKAGVSRRTWYRHLRKARLARAAE